MPSGPRPTSRPGAGPGRGKPRARSIPRKAAAHRPGHGNQSGPDSPEGSSPAEQQTAARMRRRSSITTRAIALVVVLLILTISYASSLRIYFAQRQDIAATKQQIAKSQQRIADLQTEVERWNDPAYVKSQARERLGWVVPGEVGYKVVGPDGKPINGGVELGADDQKPAGDQKRQAWWADLYGSLKTADDPAPKPKKPSDEPTITADSTPSPGR
ncbi:septum formation initiator family protein [Microlunatus panaciterrae]|uniref:Cell division protein FtsB n=1 Tax=Microlunatus panaciterrae TaxID=400768 RepID=A0ABS2RHB3_9ACTN|nr:septum formation initiator family protein [Microlunatus panaciterrae]MBM7798063.1 cell division protein FtsB [Microlunatus panaciterrae]